LRIISCDDSTSLIGPERTIEACAASGANDLAFVDRASELAGVVRLQDSLDDGGASSAPVVVLAGPHAPIISLFGVSELELAISASGNASTILVRRLLGRNGDGVRGRIEHKLAFILAVVNSPQFALHLVLQVHLNLGTELHDIGGSRQNQKKKDHTR